MPSGRTLQHRNKLGGKPNQFTSMKTLNLQLSASDSNGMQALKNFIDAFRSYKCIKTAMQFAQDFIDDEADLNEFETLLKRFKQECQTIVFGKWNDELGQIELHTLNRAELAL